MTARLVERLRRKACRPELRKLCEEGCRFRDNCEIEWEAADTLERYEKALGRIVDGPHDPGCLCRTGRKPDCPTRIAREARGIHNAEPTP